MGESRTEAIRHEQPRIGIDAPTLVLGFVAGGPLLIIKLIQSLPRVYKLEGQDKLRVTLDLPGASERIRSAQEVLVLLGARRPG